MATSERRKRMFQFNRERIEQLYVDAVSRGVDRPLIIMCDLLDPAGKALAIGRAGSNEVEKQIATCKDNGHDPSLIMDVPQENAIAVLGNATANARQVLDTEVPDGMFRVAVIGDGGISWAMGRIPH
jgi:hypothetical protein